MPGHSGSWRRFPVAYQEFDFLAIHHELDSVSPFNPEQMSVILEMLENLPDPNLLAC